jgi:hypothetical protein
MLWFVEFDDVSVLKAKVAACECTCVLLVIAPITSLGHSPDMENFTSAIIFIFLSPLIILFVLHIYFQFILIYPRHLHEYT